MKQRTDLLNIGDILNEDVTDSGGVLLMGKGAVLGEDSIKFLTERGVFAVEIEEKAFDFNALRESIKEKPQEYSISGQVIDEAIDDRSVIKEQYKAGVEAIKNVDIDTTTEIAKDICDRISGVDNLQEELSLLKNGCDSVLTHSMNVAIFTATLIVWEANVDSRTCYDAVSGAMLHDIGKLYIPREVLDKPARLTEQEYRIMQQHAELGYMKLMTSGNVSEKIALMAYEHHENFDGSGYPRHLKADEITMESKIVHVADVYEAMTAQRCYKPAMLPGDVTEYTMSKYGSMFDPKTVRDFLKTVPAYKKGDTVMLSNRELAVVTACNSLNSLRPKVKVIRTGEEIDLFRDKSKLNLTIVEMA